MFTCLVYVASNVNTISITRWAVLYTFNVYDQLCPQDNYCKNYCYSYDTTPEQPNKHNQIIAIYNYSRRKIIHVDNIAICCHVLLWGRDEHKNIH